MLGALGIPTMVYLPYCFMNMVSPLVSIFLGFTGISIIYKNGAKKKKEA